MSHEINPVFLDPEVQNALRDRDREIAMLQYKLATLLRNLREIERVFVKINATTNSSIGDQGIQLIHELSRAMRHFDSDG